MKDCLFFHRMLQALPKKRTNPANTQRTNTELSSLTVSVKIVQTRFLVSESKLFFFKKVFVLAMKKVNFKLQIYSQVSLWILG